MRLDIEKARVKLLEVQPEQPHMVQSYLNNGMEIYIIDESVNSTGTHKDRMAYAISEYYIDILQQQGGDLSYVPRFSIISSGSAAYSIQWYFNYLGLPALHVLIDNNYTQEISILRKHNCRVFPLNLSKRCLYSKEILKLSGNPSGIDITSNMAMLPYHSYYQDIAKAIITVKPDYCFLPFGSGHLFGNLIYQFMRHLPGINLIGGYTGNPASDAKKLYAPFLPFNIINDNFIATLKLAKKTGMNTALEEIKEPLLYESMKTFKEMKITAEPSAAGGLAIAMGYDPVKLGGKKILVISTGSSHYLGRIKYKKKEVTNEICTYN